MDLVTLVAVALGCFVTLVTNCQLLTGLTAIRVKLSTLPTPMYHLLADLCDESRLGLKVRLSIFLRTRT